MITYNEIIKLLNDFYTSHYQVNSFENGDLWEAIESKTFDDALYPLAFLVDAGANTTKGKLGLTFDLLCMDLVDKGEANENEVKSDTLQILTDTVSYLKQLNDGKWYTLVVEDSNNLSSFTQKMSDELTGWKITITLTQPFNYDACSIPYAGVSLIDGNCLPVAVTDTDQVTVIEVPSGGSFTCTPLSNDLFWSLDFNELSENEIIPCTAYNVGVFSSGAGVDFVTITVSTDNITYIPLVFPFSPVIGTTYYFNRSSFLGSGSYEMEGLKTNKVKTWELTFEDTNESLQVDATAENIGTFDYGEGFNTGVIQVSTDDVTFAVLVFPFIPIAGTTYYFKRTTVLVTSKYKLNGYSSTTGAESFVFSGSYKKNVVITTGLQRWLVGGVGVVGANVTDQSGNGNDYTLVNGATVNADNFELDGVSQYIATNQGVQDTELTMSCTVEYNSLTLTDRLIGQLTNIAGTWGVRAIGNSSGTGTMETYTNPAWNNLMLIPVIGTKYTFDFVIDNTNSIIKFYVDGVLMTTITDDLNFTSVGLGCKYRGAFENSMDGKWYDYKHYNRLLTQAELIQNINAM